MGTINALLVKALNRCNGCRTVYVSGHSLGGALATVAALEFKCMPDIRNVSNSDST